MRAFTCQLFLLCIYHGDSANLACKEALIKDLHHQIEALKSRVSSQVDHTDELNLLRQLVASTKEELTLKNKRAQTLSAQLRQLTKVH